MIVRKDGGGIYYIILVLTCVLLGLNCCQLYVCLCSSMERRGETAAAFTPLYKTSASNLGSEQHTDRPVPLCLKAYFCNSRSELGDDPMCSLKLLQKTWVENRQSSQAGGRGHAGSKGSLLCLFFLLLTTTWAGRKGHAYLLLILILSIQWSGKSRY